MGKRYEKTYFKKYDNIWHHGDFVATTAQGGLIVYGRSDATLNPGGVSIGTAEIYRQLFHHSDIVDAAAVGKKYEGDVRIILFLQLRSGKKLS